DKNQNQIGVASPLSSSGDRVFYDVIGGLPGSPTGGRPQMLATRTPQGWTSRDILPPADQLVSDSYLIQAATPDLSQVVEATFNALGTEVASPDVTLVKLTADGQQTILHRFPVFYGAGGPEVAASDDLSRVLTNVPFDADPSLPGATSGAANVYDVGSAAPALVSAMPGSGLAPACGVPRGSPPWGFVNASALTSEHWISTDGTKAFFQSAGNGTCASDPLQLYMRDLSSGQTVLVSGPVNGGDADHGVDRFVQATPDGSEAFFTSQTSYAAADSADGNADDEDLYEWSTATQQLSCVTCVGTSADLVGSAVVAEDGSHAYFASAAQLADAPSAATSAAPNIYVWRASDDSVHYVATADPITARPSVGGEATPDGDVLLFESDDPSLDARSGSSNGGTLQLYRYDDGDQSVTCVSCPPGGVGASDVSTQLAITSQVVQAHGRAVSDDGSIVVFATTEALVPEDVNGDLDIYEWHDGHVGLITSGTMTYAGSPPVVVSLSPDGHDLIFEDSARLTFDALDSAVKVYDARIDGGFPEPPAPPASCVGDACRPAPTPAPPLSSPNSTSTGASGNATAGPAPSFALARLSAAQRSRLARTGRLVLAVHVNQRGRVSAFAQARLGKHVRVIARAAASAKRAGTLRLQLALSKAARRQLAHAGHLRLVLAVSYSKSAADKRISVSLKARRHGR
ncbi:MAG TPA: hypothetical protein VFV85_03280, partial [Conexibacter sp.]|nr:hypothetical protein [Conexibacter sp.]